MTDVEKLVLAHIKRNPDSTHVAVRSALRLPKKVVLGALKGLVAQNLLVVSRPQAPRTWSCANADHEPSTPQSLASSPSPPRRGVKIVSIAPAAPKQAKKPPARPANTIEVPAVALPQDWKPATEHEQLVNELPIRLRSLVRGVKRTR